MIAEPAPLTWVVQTAAGLPTTPPDPDAWLEVLPDLRSSRLTPLAHHLAEAAGLSLPADVARALVLDVLRAEGMARAMRAQLVELARAADDAGLRWVILKGLPLADRLYPSAHVRPAGDIDLLVDAGQRASAERVLHELGYHRGDEHDHHLHFSRPGDAASAAIELHWASTPRGVGVDQAPALLAGRRRQAITATDTVWVPALPDELAFLIMHYLRHGGVQAIQLLDLALLTRGSLMWHPAAALIGDDLARLGFPRSIDGPSDWRRRPLCEWAGQRTFRQRRTEWTSEAPFLALALAESPVRAAGFLARLLWPASPPQRWVAHESGAQWRVVRLASYVRRRLRLTG